MDALTIERRRTIVQQVKTVELVVTSRRRVGAAHKTVIKLLDLVPPPRTRNPPPTISGPPHNCHGFVLEPLVLQLKLLNFKANLQSHFFLNLLLVHCFFFPPHQLLVILLVPFLQTVYLSLKILNLTAQQTYPVILPHLKNTPGQLACLPLHEGRFRCQPLVLLRQRRCSVHQSGVLVQKNQPLRLQHI